MVNIYASLFNCMTVGRKSDSVMARLKAIYFNWLGAGALLFVAWPTGVQMVIIFCL